MKQLLGKQYTKRQLPRKRYWGNFDLKFTITSLQLYLQIYIT